jgi:Na+/H+ antiporter NhaD/arsenite permease-like protein
MSRLKQEIGIWKQSASRLSDSVTDEQVVKEKLTEHVQQLEEQLALANNEIAGKKVDLTELEKEYVIKDVPLFILCAIILSFVILMFFLETFIHQWVHFSLDSVAIIGAFAVIVLSDTHHFDHVLEKVEWSSLLFFASLFIMMGSLARLGLIDFVGDLVTSMIMQVPEDTRLPLAITVIVWLSSIISAIIDSIPYTTAMIPVILTMSEQLRLPLKPLVFALAFGTGM